MIKDDSETALKRQQSYSQFFFFKVGSATNLGDVHCSCWHHGISEFLQSLDCVSPAMYCGNLERHIWVLGDVDKTQIKHAPLDEESCLPAEIFFSPFCILPGIGHPRKRPGLNHSTTRFGLLLVFHHWVSQRCVDA